MTEAEAIEWASNGFGMIYGKVIFFSTCAALESFPSVRREHGLPQVYSTIETVEYTCLLL
ncbi:hypothetical protein [Sporomusa sp. GT1]|uniref:hypothetical protein n=1 Tax=Sporomusa sp. GT1 TaxID=1534747 RepID=UPI00166D0C8E|nr:hypothetical protein [Sporomusa sp. GT1]